jgi:hypothetical protein
MQMAQHMNMESNKEVHMKKTLFIVAVAAVMVFALAAPAFAEGYNNGGYNFTTGATTNACARALKQAGASEVCVWTVARGL